MAFSLQPVISILPAMFIVGTAHPTVGSQADGLEHPGFRLIADCMTLLSDVDVIDTQIKRVSDQLNKLTSTSEFLAARTQIWDLQNGVSREKSKMSNIPVLMRKVHQNRSALRSLGCDPEALCQELQNILDRVTHLRKTET